MSRFLSALFVVAITACSLAASMPNSVDRSIAPPSSGMSRLGTPRAAST